MPPNFCSHCGARFTPHPQSPLHCAHCGAQQITPPPTLRQQLDELTDRPWKPLTLQNYFECALTGAAVGFAGFFLYNSSVAELPFGRALNAAVLWAVLLGVGMPALLALIAWIHSSLGK